MKEESRNHSCGSVNFTFRPHSGPFRPHSGPFRDQPLEIHTGDDGTPEHVTLYGCEIDYDDWEHLADTLEIAAQEQLDN